MRRRLKLVYQYNNWCGWPLGWDELEMLVYRLYDDTKLWAYVGGAAFRVRFCFRFVKVMAYSFIAEVMKKGGWHG